MNSKRLEELTEEFLEKSREIMTQKQQEYSVDDDRLLNFKQRGMMLGNSPAQVCMSDFSKHVQSLGRAVTTGEGEWSWRTEEGGEGLKQRIVDSLNYLFLLAAALEEERGSMSNKARWALNEYYQI